MEQNEKRGLNPETIRIIIGIAAMAAIIIIAKLLFT